MAGSWNTCADKCLLFYEQHRGVNISKTNRQHMYQVAKISKIGILKCDELVLQDMQEIVIKMYDILCIE